MGPWKVLAAMLALGLAPVTYAKGNFQAQGTISDVQRHGVEITFRFSGSVSLGYATAPQGDAARTWEQVALRATGIEIHIGDWTQVHRPSEKASQPDTERIYSRLSELMKAGSIVQLSVDNPSLSFSNIGELTGVSGTFVYAVIRNEAAEQTLPADAR